MTGLKARSHTESMLDCGIVRLTATEQNAIKEALRKEDPVFNYEFADLFENTPLLLTMDTGHPELLPKIQQLRSLSVSSSKANWSNKSQGLALELFRLLSSFKRLVSRSI